jgi:hypothetical protein
LTAEYSAIAASNAGLSAYRSGSPSRCKSASWVTWASAIASSTIDRRERSSFPERYARLRASASERFCSFVLGALPFGSVTVAGVGPPAGALGPSDDACSGAEARRTCSRFHRK